MHSILLTHSCQLRALEEGVVRCIMHDVEAYTEPEEAQNETQKNIQYYRLLEHA